MVNNEDSISSIHFLMAQNKNEVTDWINSINKSLDGRIQDCIESKFKSETILKLQNHIDALEQYKEENPLTIEQLSCLYTRLKLAFEEVRLSNDNYALYDQMNRVIKELDLMKNRLTKIESKQKEIDDGEKYIDSEITADDLKKLYDESSLSPDKVAKDFNISKPTFYNILNCKDGDLKRRQELKQYLEKAINYKKEAK